tara:strand:- start:540 stop:767 length:228 start_codon:yes stop_codon:yes gene_type:complete
MTRKERDILTNNAQKMSSFGADSIVSEVSTKMQDNVKGAIIGGGIGVLIGIATRKSLVVSGIIGLVLGRFIFKTN